MDWNSLGPAVFSLLGVALGTIGSLLGVYYAQRTAREQARLQHSAAMRIERRDIYLEYLSAVENSWSFLDGLWGRQPLTSADGVPLNEDAVDREAAIRNHEVWYYQQKLALVASNEARNAALDLTSKMYEATFHRERVTESLWRYLDPTQQAFLAAAREDLGLSFPGSADARATDRKLSTRLRQLNVMPQVSGPEGSPAMRQMRAFVHGHLIRLARYALGVRDGVVKPKGRPAARTRPCVTKAG